MVASPLDWLRALRLAAVSGRLRRRRIVRAQRYLADLRRFRALGGQAGVLRPMLDDAEEGAGSASGHYFHQDLLVASRIFGSAPRRHVDVGSRIDGFVAHLAAFRRVEVIDIRPLPPTQHEGIVFLQANVMDGAGVADAICDSLSCLHALEHFGLGRYGDPLDPQGHRKGFENLYRMLQPGGVLYLSVPIGASATHFNAHRVFAPTEPLTWASGRFALESFDYVDDEGRLVRDADPAEVPALRYGCGIYTLRKVNAL